MDDCFKPEAIVMATCMYDSMGALQRFDMDATLPQTSVWDIAVGHDSLINFAVASDLTSNISKFVIHPMNRIIPAPHNNSTPCRSRRKSP